MLTKVKIILRKYQSEFMWESFETYEARINEFTNNHDVVELAPIGMDGVMIRYIPHELIVPDHSGPSSGLKLEEVEYRPTSPNVRSTEYTWTRVGRNPPPFCYKCKEAIVFPDQPIPASGTHNLLVHSSCNQGCIDGGPHSLIEVKHSHYKKCIRCGRGDIL